MPDQIIPNTERLYELFQSRPVGAIVKWQEISDTLGIDAQDKNNRPYVYNVRYALEDQEGRTIVGVPNVGYRIQAVPEGGRKKRKYNRAGSVRQLRPSNAPAARSQRPALAATGTDGDSWSLGTPPPPPLPYRASPSLATSASVSSEEPSTSQPADSGLPTDYTPPPPPPPSFSSGPPKSEPMPEPPPAAPPVKPAPPALDAAEVTGRLDSHDQLFEHHARDIDALTEQVKALTARADDLEGRLKVAYQWIEWLKQLPDAARVLRG